TNAEPESYFQQNGPHPDPSRPTGEGTTRGAAGSFQSDRIRRPTVDDSPSPIRMCLAWRPRCRFPNLLYRGFLTRKRFAASKAPELATVLPIGNRRYSRFGNLLRPKGANTKPALSFGRKSTQRSSPGRPAAESSAPSSDTS